MLAMKVDVLTHGRVEEVTSFIRILLRFQLFFLVIVEQDGVHCSMLMNSMWRNKREIWMLLLLLILNIVKFKLGNHHLRFCR